MAPTVSQMLGFCFADILRYTRHGRTQAWVQLVRLTVGHRGGEEDGPEASPSFVRMWQLCVSENRVNRAMWNHKAVLIKGV